MVKEVECAMDGAGCEETGERLWLLALPETDKLEGRLTVETRDRFGSAAAALINKRIIIIIIIIISSLMRKSGTVSS